MLFLFFFFFKEKSNLTRNSHIAFLLPPVCSCEAGAILAFCRSIRPVCDIIIIWPDALIRTGELSHPRAGLIRLLSGHIILSTAFAGHSALRRAACAPTTPRLSIYPRWQRARPSTHSPWMQSGRPSESSSRHRWGKYNSGDWQSKGGVWPAVEWGVWLASAGNVDMSYFLMRWWKSSRASFFIFIFFIPLCRTVLFQILQEMWIRSEVFSALCGCMYWCQSFPSMFVCLHLVSLSVGVLPQSVFAWRLREAVSCERSQEGGCKELLTKEETSRPMTVGLEQQMLSICISSSLSLFNRLWLIALAGVECPGSLFSAFVCGTWDRTGNARDILFLCDTLIVLLGEFLARKIPFTVIGCE